MPRICYVNKRFSNGSQNLIATANEIIGEYQEQGYTLTLRQLYYQFVARDIIPNKQSEYKRLGSVINDARLAGEIDWRAIEDRTRNLEALSHWGGPEEIIRACGNQYMVDRWSNQSTRVEVWVEKEALAGVFAGVCDEWDVAYFSCRGYVSQSEMWNAAQRLKRYERSGQSTLILHFGDHDPSGMDMSRDINDRLHLFGSGVKMRRIALNMDQIEEHDPPPNPAKLTDSRVKDYIANYGDDSWELDALEPSLLTTLVETEVREVLDTEAWDQRIEEEDEAKQWLASVAENWEAVVDFMQE